MEAEKPANHYVFYLQLSLKLGQDFYYLASILSDWGITLVPVKPKDLPNYLNSGKPHVISCTSFLPTRAMFEKTRKKFLDFTLKNNRIVLHHISSFGKIDRAHNLERSGSYHFYRLPVLLEELCQEISLLYYKDKARELSGKSYKKDRPGMHRNF